MKMTGQTILITGGGSGIGLALARDLSAKGNQVIICGRSEHKLKAAKQACPQLEFKTCDITDESSRRHLSDFIRSEFPACNILVNNAGVQYNYLFTDEQSHAAQIQTEININFLSQVKLTELFLPHLLKQQEAAIINVTSALAVVPKENAAVYCASKSALRTFCKALRYQLEATPVRVFEIIPALVETEMTAGRGRDKISPETVSKEAIRGIEAERYEIRIGKTKVLFALNRLLPSLAEKIIRRS